MERLTPNCKKISHEVETIEQIRRFANYKPTIWKHDFLESLCNKFDDEEYRRRVEKLTEDVKLMLVDQENHELPKLELIDNIMKLGLSNLFLDEIQKTLDVVAEKPSKNKRLDLEDHLYSIALRFRLLRQHGYNVSQGMFRIFLDEKDAFAKNKFSVDIKGLLELLEASYLGFEGEDILDKAKEFSREMLQNVISTLGGDLAKQVAHSLELPSQWRVQWLDVKWHFNMFKRAKNVDPKLLELARLHFNMVQAAHQQDLRETSMWWRSLALKDLSFTRDRIAESFLCSIGLVYEAHNSNFRKWMTKVTTLILVIDDVYDVYGSIQELELFTNSVDRWDHPKDNQHLPECMKTCFQALYDTINDISSEIQAENVQVALYLKEAWAEFCKALFVEAKWYNEGYIPSLREYLDNGWISSCVKLISVHSILFLKHDVNEEIVTSFLEKHRDLVYNVSIIARLCNDLATSTAEQERGDAASSIVCYMREMNVSEDAAREHVMDVIDKTWKKLNGQCFTTSSPLMQPFVNVITNIARMIHFLYQYGDGFGVQDRETKKQILSLLVEPITALIV